jgi:aspartokinase/homoserine dehydrogenase 1
MSTLVMKFGGSTVGMTTGLTQVLSIVLYEREHWSRLLLVVSALEGVTDALLEAAHLAQLGNRRGYRRIVANVRTRHLALIEHLPLGQTERAALQADIDRLLFDMLDTCQVLSEEPEIPPAKPPFPSPAAALDAIIGVGERLAARIVAALLRQNNLRSVALDAGDLIITDETYGNASPLIDLTRQRIANNLLPMLERGIIPVITGFIGATASGRPTTLGRGGSDYSASIIGLCADADEVWIWTDVDGMMSADPGEVPFAHVIPSLSYDEVAEMAFFGARVLHSRMIGPLREKSIPLRVRNIFKPQQPGTLIKALPLISSRPKAVTAISGLGLFAPVSGSLNGITQLVDEALQAVVRSRVDVMFAAQGASHSFVCFVIPTTAGIDASHNLYLEVSDRLRRSPEFSVWSARLTCIVTVVGDRLSENNALTASILAALGDIRVLAMAQSPTQTAFSVVVAPEDCERAVAEIHRLLVKGDSA